jgi:hypothetical protein
LNRNFNIAVGSQAEVPTRLHTSTIGGTGPPVVILGLDPSIHAATKPKGAAVKNSAPWLRSGVTEWQLCLSECGFVSNDGIEDDQELPGDGNDCQLLGA